MIRFVNPRFKQTCFLIRPVESRSAVMQSLLNYRPAHPVIDPQSAL
jgi:hypothetical protein